MAKLQSPLMSFGASGTIGKSLVFGSWKGLNTVRSWVKGANPNSTLQQVQRGYIRDCVAKIHAQMADVTNPLIEVDFVAYGKLASTMAKPMTWFNLAVRQWALQHKAGLKGCLHVLVYISPGDTTLDVDVITKPEGTNAVTAANIFYGTNPNALYQFIEGTVAAGEVTGQITGLTNGVKYFVQVRPTAHSDFVGANSGLYNGTPTL